MTGSWFLCRRPKPDAAVRLITCPYAGGNAVTYRPWDDLLPADVEMHAALLPGRGSRFADPPLQSIDRMVDGLLPETLALAGRGPVAFFGHSMGGLVAFELARRVAAAGKAPAHLFISARQAPQLPWRRPEIHALPEPAFLAALQRLGGTPAEVLADRELMALALPALRADFTAVERYRMKAGPKLACDLGVFGGSADPDVTADDLLAWQDLTSAMALVEMLPGGHFFLEATPEPVVRTVAKDLERWR